MNQNHLGLEAMKIVKKKVDDYAEGWMRAAERREHKNESDFCKGNGENL